MNEKRILSLFALGLLVAGLLVPFVIALFGRNELAIGFAAVAELLALVFGVLSLSERIGKIVTVMTGILAVSTVVTVAILIPIREREEVARREELRNQMLQIDEAMRSSVNPGDHAAHGHEATHSH